MASFHGLFFSEISRFPQFLMTGLVSTKLSINSLQFDSELCYQSNFQISIDSESINCLQNCFQQVKSYAIFRHTTGNPSPLCLLTRSNKACFLCRALEDSNSYRVHRLNKIPSWRFLSGFPWTRASRVFRASFSLPRYRQHTAMLFTA